MSAIITSPYLKTYTLEEFWKLPDPPGGEKLELIGGVLYMTPPPGGTHNEVVSRLVRELAAFLKRKDDPGRLYLPRAAIWTGPATYLEPDLMYISQHLLAQMDLDHLIKADLVVEVISPGSAIYDRNAKAETYGALGVGELWLIDPRNRTLEAVGWDSQGRPSKSVLGRGAEAEAECLPGFKLPLRILFD
ncbi:MAG: Uma2 family endonuclease [Acidobacteriota bacterium]